MNVLTYVYRADIFLHHLAQAVSKVAHLALGHEHQAAAMGEPRVGAEQAVEIGVVGHRDCGQGAIVVQRIGVRVSVCLQTLGDGGLNGEAAFQQTYASISSIERRSRF